MESNLEIKKTIDEREMQKQQNKKKERQKGTGEQKL